MTAFDPTPLRPDAPAMPVHGGWYETDDPRNQILGGGLTARQHAAIALCVPDSGCDWLDAMIERRRRDEFIRAVMVSIDNVCDWPQVPNAIAAEAAVQLADAMLAASKKEPA